MNEDNYENSFERYNAPKWLERYCRIVNGGIFLLLFLNTVIKGIGLEKWISNYSFSFDYILVSLMHLICIVFLFAGFVISFAISAIGNHYFDYCTRGKNKIATMLSSVITIPGAIVFVVFVASMFTGCADSPLWGILDPRFIN